MTDLTDFLLARIAEDEAWTIEDRDCTCANLPEPGCAARVLAECEAKRRIVSQHGRNRYGVDPCDAHDASGHTVPCLTIRALALPYAEHSEFQEAWRP